MTAIEQSDEESEIPQKIDRRKGNQFWKARTKHGRDRIFANSDLLWESCCEYFQWVEDNPLWESKVAQYQGAPVSMNVDKMRAMTLGGLCLFLDIDENTWRDWKTKDDFSRVILKAERVMYHQKFSGAAAELLNANIIARDLGLVDKKETELSGTVRLETLSDDELEQKLKSLINK